MIAVAIVNVDVPPAAAAQVNVMARVPLVAQWSWWWPSPMSYCFPTVMVSDCGIVDLVSLNDGGGDDDLRRPATLLTDFNGIRNYRST